MNDIVQSFLLLVDGLVGTFFCSLRTLVAFQYNLIVNLRASDPLKFLWMSDRENS